MNYKGKIIGIVIVFKEFVIGGPTKHPRDMSHLLLMDGLVLYLRHGIQMQNQLILFDKNWCSIPFDSDAERKLHEYPE